MSSKDKYAYLLKNTFLFTISSLGSKILIFLLIPLYTHVLSTEEYGTADLIQTTTTLLIYFFTLNIADAVLRYAIDRDGQKVQYLSYGIKILFKGSIVLAIIEVIIWNLEILPWDSSTYVFLFLVFFSTAFNQIYSSYLRASDKILEVAISGIIVTASTIISNIILLLVFKLGLFGYLASIVVGNAISLCYMSFSVNIGFKSIISENISRGERERILKYSIPLSFNGIAWWINNSLDKYFITAICGIGLNGIYSISYKIPTMLSVLQTIFNQAWNLSAIKEFNKKDVDDFFTKTYKCYNAGHIIVCSFLIILNRFIAKLIFANEFYTAWRYAPILLISVIFSALSGFVGSVFTAVKKSNLFAISTISAAIVNTILNILLIPIYGGYGAAIATGLSFVIIWLIRLICAKKYINLKINIFKDFLSYFLLCLQVVLELNYSRLYYVQIIIIILQIIIHNRSIVVIIKKFLELLQSKMGSVQK